MGFKHSYPKAALYFSMLALALAVSACAKGFKLKEDAKKAKIPVAATQVTPTVNTYEPLLGLAAQQSEEINVMVTNPANRGRLQVDGKIGFVFTSLDPKKDLSAEDSVLYFELTVKSPDNQEKKVLLVSNEAVLNVTKSTQSSDVAITGYWKINRPDGNPLYVGIDSVVKIVGTSLVLQGGLYANFHSGLEGQQLANLNLPLCTVLAETAWLKAVYGEHVEDSTCTIITY